MSIKEKIDESVCKKIFSNSLNKKQYLLELEKVKKIELGISNSMSSNELNEIIIQTWDYEISKNIIRSFFKQSEKYIRGSQANIIMMKYINEWSTLELGDINWPFSQGQFDNYVQSLNKKNISDLEKDEEIKMSAVKFRRLKEINTLRNDYLEKLIFDLNDNIIPTLNHRRGVDFYIDGISFDQKVSKSVTNEFKEKYGDNRRNIAINNPSEVAKYLYRYQDEGRFGADNRLLVVYLDENISVDRISQIIKQTSLKEKININFTYSHKNSAEKNYDVSCFVIMLYNQ